MMCKCDEELIDSLKEQECPPEDMAMLVMFFESVHSADCQHCNLLIDAGEWNGSRLAHNQEIFGSTPIPATKIS